jgi:uncharacterized protein YraI
MMIGLVAATASLGAVGAQASSGWVQQGVSLNARSGPSTSYPVIHTFSSCSELTLGQWQNGWVQVSYNYQNYWVSGQYVANHACQPYQPTHNQGYPTQKPVYKAPTGGTTYKKY